MTEHAAFGVPQWTMGDRLGKSLDYAKLTVGEMADYLGISRNTVGNYIAGRTRVPKPTLTLWAMRTGVPKEWIESGESPFDTGGGPDDGGAQPPSTLVRSYRTSQRAA